jgi:hypothetical protein
MAASRYRGIRFRACGLASQITVPDDFDRMGLAENEQLFGGAE